MKVYLETFGCQMNELDSELVRGQLQSLGYRFTTEPDDAQIVLYNTCSVREHAEQKAYSRLGIVGKRKDQGEDIILGVLGCMAERDGVDMLRRYPQVDLLCGPGELDKLPALIENVRRTAHPGLDGRVALAGNKSRRSATLGAAEDSLEALDLGRAFELRPDAESRSAYVRITRGCNKFCTYCVVPNTRGAEVHRPPDHIVEECRRLAGAGVLEVTLLGQTVNHYLYVHGAAVGVDGSEVPQVGPGAAAFARGGSERLSAGGRRVTTFASLLNRIHDEVPEIARLRFVTSYPRDFGDDVLDVMAACPRICRYLHAPAQSGSNRILKLMNRGYTVEEYRDFAARAIEKLPDLSLAGDIIVGFPTETDDDFAATVDLVRSLPFKNNFIFKYSPRPGTTAIDRYPDDVAPEVKKYRNNALLAVQTEVSSRVHTAWVGRTIDVLVEGLSPASQNERRESDASASGQRRSVGAPQQPSVELRLPARIAAKPAEPPQRSLSRALRHQLVGRTGGDLITFFECPLGVEPEAMIGRIVPVTVTEAGPLFVKGDLQPPLAHARL
ncbi:MAG: MiaB/RimO family radical SAM methylthiotransferase [Phycisphaerae bacterium]|nr:MiaB/RimO family radical SAM methylthiotransferase [Phycisphaerae bacterium]